jgi:hypothetical protein
VSGNRHRPDGLELTWKQIGVNGLIADPQLPFFVEWKSPLSDHPRAGADPAYSLACLEIAGDPRRVSEWLGETVEAPLEDVKVEWVAPHGTPGSAGVGQFSAAASARALACASRALQSPSEIFHFALPTIGRTSLGTSRRSREPSASPMGRRRSAAAASACASTARASDEASWACRSQTRDASKPICSSLRVWRRFRCSQASSSLTRVS